MDIDGALWSRIRLGVGAFVENPFRQDAFQETSSRKASFVRGDGGTTTQTHSDHGIGNIEVGFAPSTPAEVIVIRIRQVAGGPGA